MAKEKPHVLICVDRDGTLIYDDHYHLGKDNYWRFKVKIMPKTVEGMQYIDKFFPNRACRFIITNQPGVAINQFKRLTLKRAEKVCKEISLMFKRKEAYFDGCIICPHVTPEYTKEHPEFTFDKKYVKNQCNCFKPRTGMIEEALAKKNLDAKKTHVYIIGDRESDILTAINAKGVGILVPFENRTHEIPKVEKLKKKNPNSVFIVKDFLEAIKLIIKREK